MIFIEPLRDTAWRSPSHKIYSENKYALFHYNHPHKDNNKRRREISSNVHNSTATFTDKNNNSTPVLVIYAFINRHYILDLLPNVSIVRNLLNQGLDLFATDWGTPVAYDKELTLGHYVNNYLDNAVDYIKKDTGSNKVSLFGYCWGGNLALMYAALHPDKVKNIVTLATPGDCSLDNTLLSIWTKKINPDSIVATFGNAPSLLLNAAFALRSPLDYLHKYPHFFLEGKQPRSLQDIIEFYATETWLYDSPPIIGEIYRQFIRDCYQKNLFIKSEMRIADNMPINLKNIKMPFLNVIAAKDDLVEPDSSRALNGAIGSSDNELIEFKSGHVGACIGSRAHKELWPKVGSWLIERS